MNNNLKKNTKDELIDEILKLREKNSYYQPTSKKAKALNYKVLKYTEHSIMAGIRVILALNSLGIRDFLRKKIDKLNLGNLCLFETLANPYEILGKL